MSTSAGQTFHTTTLFIAAGVGAFVPRRMALEGLTAFEGTQVFAEHPTPERWAGQHLVVAGDGDTALQTCLDSSTGPQAASSSPPSRPAPRTGIITCHRHLLHTVSCSILLRRKQISSISDPAAYAAAAAIPATLRLDAIPAPAGRFALWRQRAPPPVVRAARGDRPQVLPLSHAAFLPSIRHIPNRSFK